MKLCPHCGKPLIAAQSRPPPASFLDPYLQVAIEMFDEGNRNLFSIAKRLYEPPFSVRAPKAIEQQKHQINAISHTLRRLLAKSGRKPPEKSTRERNSALYEARVSGKKFADLAKLFGISKGRARQLFLNEQRRRRSPYA